MRYVERMPIVAVTPGRAIRDHRRLFEALETAFDVRFVPGDRAAVDPHDAVVQVGAGSVRPAWIAPNIPVLAFSERSSVTERPVPVRLLDCASVDRRLRGSVLLTAPAGRLLEVADGGSVLALGEAGPMWTDCPVTRFARVRALLPTVAADEVLVDVLRSVRALALIALVSFIRSLRPESCSPLRAAFVFDDPNLRRDTYGFIDYRRLAAHADAHGYHAAMALIPRDAHRWDAETVGLFRTRPDRLSLVMHGNDHSSLELMRTREFPDALSLGAQALRRVAAFERGAGLGVDRVMMPPHGLCSRSVTRALGALGYDALCAKHPCPWSDRPPRTRVLAGWSRAEIIDGCAVVPRLHLSSPAIEISLRAFLDQPLVLYGHHGDLAHGLDPLSEAAASINRLGDVSWCSVGRIIDQNYALTSCGDLVVVRPWANRISVSLPEGAARLTVEPSRLEATQEGLCGWRVEGLGSTIAFGVPEPLNGARSATIRLQSRWKTDPAKVPDPPWRAWPRVRRTATEARDRIAPLAIRTRTLAQR